MVMSVEYEAALAARRAEFQALRAEARRVERLAGSEVSFVVIPRGWITRIQEHLEALAKDDDESPSRDLLVEIRDSAAADAPYQVKADHYETLDACMRRMFVRCEDKLSILTDGYTPHEQLEEFLLTEELQVVSEFDVVLRSLLL
jgi:hypothetical protein